MKRILIGLVLVALSLVMVRPSMVQGQEAELQIAVSVRPTLTVNITEGPEPFQVRQSDRGREVSLPIAGEVRTNLKWVIALELPDSVLGPGGYRIDGSAIRLRPSSGVAGLGLEAPDLALLIGRPTPGLVFGNQLTVRIPPGAPPGTYEVRLYLSITPGDLGATPYR